MVLRNKYQTNPKWKHNSRSKGLRQSAKSHADGPRGRGGQSARARQSVRRVSTDSSYWWTKPPVAPQKNTNSPYWTRGWSETFL
jgi:hypothetical protein